MCFQHKFSTVIYFFLIVIFGCTYTTGEYTCECTCIPTRECATAAVSHEAPYEIEDISNSCHLDHIPYCNNRKRHCEPFSGCCWTNDFILKCEHGPRYLCDKPPSCYRAKNCRCEPLPGSSSHYSWWHSDELSSYYYSDYQSLEPSSDSNTNTGSDYSQESSQDFEQGVSDQRSPSNDLAVGIGVGIGASLLLALLVVLVACCRKQMVHKKTKEDKSKEAAAVNKSYCDRGDESEVYAEIIENRYTSQNSISGAPNFTYGTSFETNNTNYSYTDPSAPYQEINSQYQSLKRPNYDMGNGEYVDPEKYTTPPAVAKRDNIEDEEKGGVSQGTPASERANTVVDSTSRGQGSSDDYIDEEDLSLSTRFRYSRESDYVEFDS